MDDTSVRRKVIGKNRPVTVGAAIRPKESSLRRRETEESRRASESVKAPVHQVQYNFEDEGREEAFARAQYPSEKELSRYRWYRKEWHRRAAELDAGDIPLAVTCELVSTCNLACGMCYTITDDFRDLVSGDQRMLPWETVKAIIDECAEMGVPSMLFSWRGESALYRQRHGEDVFRFADVLAYARKKGILEITSLTHGQLIDDEMAEAIVDAEPNWISFSVDGLGEDYNKIRTPPGKRDQAYDAFEELTGAIRRLVAARDKSGKMRPQIRTNTIFPAIAKDPERYRRVLLDLGVDMITVNEMLDLRDGEVPEDMIMRDWACAYPFQRLAVAANGIILPCTGAYYEQENLVLGRYRGTQPKILGADAGKVTRSLELTLREAWSCDKVGRIRDLHRNGRRCEIHPGCRHCNHGVKKAGVDRLPDDWNLNTMSWDGKERDG
ncbi:MAG: radical SAM protein [Rhodospirillales bacterium]|nr:radical SAM protein [Rhodospirillales bacterium]